MSKITLVEQSVDPSPPAVSRRTLYAKSDGLYEIDAAGVITSLVSGGGGGGEANDGTNLGVGEGVYAGKSGATLQFKSLLATSPIAVTSTVDEITFALTGEINDANHGTRSGGTLHAVATVSVAGFMSSTDKSKLDGFTAVGDYIRADGTVSFTGAQSLGNQDLTAIKTATFNAEFDNGNSGTAATVDWNSGQKQRITLTNTSTLSFTDPPGACNLMLKLIQDATGGRDVTWPANVLWSQGLTPNLTVNANAVDLVSFYFDGTDYYGFFADNFS